MWRWTPGREESHSQSVASALARASYSQGNKRTRYPRSLANIKAHFAKVQPARTLLGSKGISKMRQRKQSKTSDVLYAQVRPGERSNGAQG